MPGGGAAHQVLAGQLGGAVDAERRRQGVLRQRRPGRLAAEHVVGADVDQRRVGCGAGPSQVQGALGVDAERVNEFALALVHMIERGGVDNDCRRVCRERSLDRPGVGDVELGARERDR